MQRPDAIIDITIGLWEQLASELVTIIGAGGFNALYSRSAHMVNSAFPWVVVSPPSQPANSQFTSLKACLEGRDIAEASEASIALLVTFIDILALLIGELLTTGILHSAWGEGVLNTASKEF